MEKRSKFSVNDVLSYATDKSKVKPSSPAIPENLSAFARYLVNQKLGEWGMADLGTPKGKITEDALSNNTTETLRVAIENAKSKGRSYVTYDDYPDMYNGMSIKDFVANESARKEQYGSGIPAYARIMMDSYDPSLAAATLLGAFRFTEDENGYSISEPYDFGKIKEGSGDQDPYRKIREYVGTDPSKQVPLEVQMYVKRGNNDGKQRE